MKKLQHKWTYERLPQAREEQYKRIISSMEIPVSLDDPRVKRCMTAIYLYTSVSELSSDYHHSMLNRHSCKWTQFHICLRVGISFHNSFFEVPEMFSKLPMFHSASKDEIPCRLYHGIANINLPKWILSSGRMTYGMIISTSPSYDLVRNNFAKENGIIFALDSSLRSVDVYGRRQENCFMDHADVSWISPYVFEDERLAIIKPVLYSKGMKITKDPLHKDTATLQHYLLSQD